MSGCSSSDSDAGGDGTLVFGITADPAQMIPWTATSEQAIQVLSQIYSPLLNTDENSAPVAGLADLPKVSDDGKTYTFTLKDGLTR
jgi:peptide/nickel transport system substrate-binding protein